MNGFEIPQGAMPDPVPAAPPPDPAMAREQAIADTTRAEEALNGLIAAKQHALFEAPDAFYRTQGSDAIHAAPAILDRLSQLRDDHLAGLANDAQRNRLAPALDAHMDLARNDVARHVAEQSLAWQRRVAQDRIALLTKEAALHHNDDGLVDAIGHAAATAARAHARIGDASPDQEAEDTAATTARSGILGAAIQARLDRGDTEGAKALFTQVQDQLDPAHAAPLKGQIDTVQRLNAAKDYADGVVSAAPAASPEKIDTQHQAAMQQAEADHPDDPRQQTLAQHFLNQAFDGRRRELQQGDTGAAEVVDDWLNTPGADSGLQRDLPPPAVLSRLDDNALRDLVFRIGRDDQGIGVTQLPYNPSLDGVPALQNLVDVPEGESVPGRTKDGIVPVNSSSSQETNQGDVEVAQASPGVRQAKPQPRRREIPPEQLAYPTDAQQKEIASHLHPEEISQAADRRKAAWDEMLKQLPKKGPRIKVPLSEDWRADLNKIDPSYAKLTEAAANKYDIPPELLARLFHTESGYDQHADNGVRKGIPQMGVDELRAVGVNPATFLDASAETQINAGAAYLAKQYGTFRNWPQAVAAYHNGRKSIEDWAAGAGPNYHSKEEIGKPYVGYGGDLRVLTTPKDIADSKNIMKHWDELRGELPYVFLGNANRYDKAKVP